MLYPTSKLSKMKAVIKEWSYLIVLQLRSKLCSCLQYNIVCNSFQSHTCRLVCFVNMIVVVPSATTQMIRNPLVG